MKKSLEDKLTIGDVTDSPKSLMDGICKQWDILQETKKFEPNDKVCDFRIKRKKGESKRKFYRRQEELIKEFVEDHLWFIERGERKRIKLIRKHCQVIADLFYQRKDLKTGAPIQAIIVWANRGGGKSLIAAIVIYLCMVWKRISFSDLAGSQDQAVEVYSYVTAFWECIPIIKERLLDGEPLMHKTKFKNEVSLKCIANSQSQVRGKHPEGLVADEVCQKENYKDDNVLAATNSVLTQDDFIILYISTFHLATGLFADTWSQSEALDFKRYRWNIYDCVLPETQIVTYNGIKPIKEVKVGDKVLTSAGIFKKVLNVWKKKSTKKCFNIDVYGAAGKNEFTEDHRVKVLRGNFRDKYNKWEKPGREWTYDKGKIIWTKVKNIKQDDFVVLPVPKQVGTKDRFLRFESPGKGRAEYRDYFDYELSVDYDLGLFLGIILGDGCSTDTSRITVCFNSRDKDWIKTYKDLVFKLFGIKCKKKYKGNCTKIIFSLKGLGEWLKENCYKEFKKHIDFKRIWQADKDFLLGYIKGLFITDGCLPTRPGKIRNKGNGDTISFINTSKNLVDSLWASLLRVGIISSKRECDNKPGVWTLSIGGNNGRNLLRLCGENVINPKGGYSRQYRKGNYLFSQIEGITEISNPGYVYDIEVEGVHDFVAGSTIAHNCMERCIKKINCKQCRLTRKKVKKDPEGNIVKIRYFGCNGRARKADGWLSYLQIRKIKKKAEIRGDNWRIEFECASPGSTRGKIYKTNKIKKTLVDRMVVPKEAKRAVGIDFGTSKQCAIVYTIMGKNKLLVPWSDMSVGKDLEYIAKTLDAMKKRYGDFIVYGDSEQSYGIMYLRKAGFTVESVAFNKWKEPGIRNLERYFNSSRIKILNVKPNRILWKDLINYKRDDNGKIIKKNDHAPDALMCAGLAFDFVYYFGRLMKKEAAEDLLKEQVEEDGQVEVF